MRVNIKPFAVNIRSDTNKILIKWELCGENLGMPDLLFRRHVLNNTGRLAGWFEFSKIRVYIGTVCICIIRVVFWDWDKRIFYSKGLHKSINRGLAPTHATFLLPINMHRR